MDLIEEKRETELLTIVNIYLLKTNDLSFFFPRKNF